MKSIADEAMQIIKKHIINGKSGLTQAEISAILGNDENHIRHLFAEKYKVTINYILKRNDLRLAYSQWVKDGAKTLTVRTTINGLKEFKTKFARMFGLSPEEAYHQNILAEDLDVPPEVFGTLYDLSEHGLINDYSFCGDKLNMTLNPQEIVKYILHLPVYALPREPFVLRSDKDDLAPILILLYPLVIFGEHKAHLKEDDYCIELENLYHIYDLDKPLIWGQLDIYAPKFNDELKPAFFKLLNQKDFRDNLVPFSPIWADNLPLDFACLSWLRKKHLLEIEKDIIYQKCKDGLLRLNPLD